MDIKLVYRIHKWLAVVVAIATLAWFVSGALMVVPERWLTLSPNVPGPRAESTLPGAPEFDQASLTPSAAIVTLTAHLAHPPRVAGINLRRLPGGLAYQVSTAADGERYVDAVHGTVFTVTGPF